MAEPLLLPTADPTAPGSAPPAAAVPTTTTFTSPASLADFQQPMQTYLATHPEFDGIAVGACVFSQPQPQSQSQSDLHSTEEPRILLVQRAPTDSMPLLWEVPGGACDFEDESLLHAVARELREESGLGARRVEALVLVDGPGSGSASGPGSGGGSGSGLGDVFFTRRGRRSEFFLFSSFFFSAPWISFLRTCVYIKTCISKAWWVAY